MIKNKKKFNSRGVTKGWFPIKQYRFKIDKHPIVVSSERRAAKVNALFSAAELRILEGVSLMLQVDQNEALRICAYEAAKAEPEVFQRHLAKAVNLTKERMHKTRNHKVAVQLPLQEKQALDNLAQSLGLTMAETLRLSVIRIGMDVRDELLKRLTNSWLISNDKLAMEWSRANDGKEPTLAPLKTAAAEAYEEAWQREQERQDDLEEARTAMLLELGPLSRMFAGSDDWTYVDAQIELRAQEERESLLAALPTDEDRYWYRVAEFEDMGLTEEEAKQAVAEEDAEEEPLDDETLRFIGLLD